MDIYVGDGNAVRMECEETGDLKSPNQHEWVLKSDVDKDAKQTITACKGQITSIL